MVRVIFFPFGVSARKIRFAKPLSRRMAWSVVAGYALAGCLMMAAARLGAQQTPDATAAAPATASSQQTAAQSKDSAHGTAATGDAQQTKRIMDVIPNFRAVSSTQKLPAMTVKQKFVGATEDSFDYSAIFIPAVLAGYSLEENSTPEFGQGGLGYARYLWHSAVDQTDENYLVEFAVPAVTHEDPRYYTLGHGGLFKRTGYALSRAVVTRTDSDKETFNFSEVVGAGAASGLSSLYYPSRERSLGNTGTEWGLDVAIDAASFVVKEFWPDVHQKLFSHGGSSGGTQ
jgi:hypothetical protein